MQITDYSLASMAYGPMGSYISGDWRVTVASSTISLHCLNVLTVEVN